MKLPQLWHRMLTRPAPRRPLRQFFVATGLCFILGLMLGLFLPSSWAMDQLPIRIDLPFRLAAFGAFNDFVATGVMLLSPSGRKRFFIVTAVLLPLVIGAGVALCIPLFASPIGDFETLIRRLPVLLTIAYGSLAIIVIGAGCGWFRWSLAIGRKERAAFEANSCASPGRRLDSYASLPCSICPHQR